MTNEEKWIIQGRTRDDLKNTKERVATLKADITSHIERLKEAEYFLVNFVSKPSNEPGPTGMTPVQYVIHFYRTFLTPHIEGKVQELAEQSERLKQLEAAVKDFSE